MRFEWYRPRLLPGFVESIWEQRASEPAKWRILPSGWLELIFRLGPAFRLEKARTLSAESDPIQHFCFLSGLHTRPLDLSFDRFHVFGVRLHPVAARALFDLPCIEVRDGAVDGTFVLDDLARIEDVLRTAPDFRARARWMEKILYARLRKTTRLETAEEMRRLASRLPVVGRASDVPDMLGYSRSHTHRICSEWLGQAASDVVRMTRFVRAVEALHDDRASLTEIGHRLGYFDQAHFIRSFRQYGELTPGEYRLRRGGAPGQLGL